MFNVDLSIGEFGGRIGIIVVVVGAILAVLGMAGHAVGGRRHYF